MNALGKSLLSNPPYNLRWKHPPLVAFLPQFIGWPIPPEGNANYAFILSGLVADTAVFLLPCAVLSGGSKEEQIIRQQLIEKNIVDAVILLPDQMFESTSIPTCILVLKRKKESRMIEMVDMRKMYETETRDQRGQYGGASHERRTYHKNIKVLNDDQIQQCVNAVQERKSAENFCKAVRYEDIKANGYTLSPSVYIEKKIEYAPHRPYKDIAADYNHIVKKKNSIKLIVNETAARRLGIPAELYNEKPDISASFQVAGGEVEQESYIHFTKSAVIKIEIDTKEGIPLLVQDFFHDWSILERTWNDEQNRILAEFRDALIPDLMEGRINVGDDDQQGGAKCQF